MIVPLLKDILVTRKKTVIALVALVLLNMVFYLYSSLFQEPRIDKINRLLEEKKRASGSGVTQDAATIFREGKKDLATWRNRIAPKKDFTRYIGSLFELAAGNSLKVGSVQYKPVPLKEENLLAFSISFDVSGKYSGIKSFMADLARSQDIMHVDNISLNNTKPTEEAISMKVQLTAYFRPEGT